MAHLGALSGVLGRRRGVRVEEQGISGSSTRKQRIRSRQIWWRGDTDPATRGHGSLYP